MPLACTMCGRPMSASARLCVRCTSAYGGRSWQPRPSLAIACAIGLYVLLVWPARPMTLLWLLIASLLVLHHLTGPRWARILEAVLITVLFLFVGSIILVLRPHLSLAVPSPTGAVVAELYERGFFVDRNFSVRLKTYWLGIIPVRQVMFDSPDEGPPGGERFLWSREGRYVLLLGTSFDPIDEACLASGEALYLLIDTATGTVFSNAAQSRLPRFSLAYVRGIDFGVALPGPSTPQPASWPTPCVVTENAVR